MQKGILKAKTKKYKAYWFTNNQFEEYLLKFLSDAQ